MFRVFHISVKNEISGVKIKKALVQYIISSVIMALVVYMEIKYLPLSPILQILLGAVSGALIYFVILVIMKNEFLQSSLNNLKLKIGAHK